MIHVHTLGGCAPAPLAQYLKALGILRVVAEQADAHARGWWEGERFRLATMLDAAALSLFLLSHYAPTPLVSPWNRGSGFYKANDPGLRPLEGSVAIRFAPIRAAIAAARALLEGIESADQQVRAIKQETKVAGLSRAQRDALRQSET